MDNPFTFGKIVQGEDFADRKDEIRELIKEVKERQGVFLISPRRYGKTSLILETLKRLRGDFYVAYIDVYRTSTLSKFLELYANQVIKEAEGRFEKAGRLVREFFSAFLPQISVFPDGTWTFGFGYGPYPESKDLLRLQEAVYELPEKIASKRGKKFVVAFDEFQEINSFDREQIEKTMRSHFQHHKNVGYIFAGSKESVLKDMTLQSEKAFYKFGRIMELKPIPRDEFRPFLLGRFTKGGLILEEGLMDAILDVAEDVPYNVQRICHELWDFCKGKGGVERADLDKALELIIMQDEVHFTRSWDDLSLHQRMLLEAIATAGESNLFSRDFITQHQLRSHSSVQTSLRRLMNSQMVTKTDVGYKISDLFFRGWILKRLGKKVTI